MTLLTFAVLSPIVFGGLAWYLFKKSYALEKEAGAKAKQASVGCFIGGLIAAFMFIGSAATLMDLAPALIKQEHIATQVIRVLDEHGWDKACEHIDCQGLVDQARGQE